VIRYFRSRSKGTARTQTDPPKLCPTNFVKRQCDRTNETSWGAYQERWTCDGVGERCRQEAHAIVNQRYYVEVCINIRCLAFGSRDGFSCERVMTPQEGCHGSNNRVCIPCLLTSNAKTPHSPLLSPVTSLAKHAKLSAEYPAP